MKPDKVTILGVDYAIQYCNWPSDVDINKHESLWGQIDYWTRTIRIYDGGRSDQDIFHSIMHEILHGISEELKLNLSKPERHDELDLLALAIMDTFFRNGWIK